MHIQNEAKKVDVTVKTIGDPDGEHTTIIRRGDREAKVYTDGWEGTPYKVVLEILDTVGVEYFLVHKN